jgi:hypothetical protein
VTGGPGGPEEWELSVAGLPLALPVELAEIAWRDRGHDVALTRTRSGDAALVTRRIAVPIVTPAPALPARA